MKKKLFTLSFLCLLINLISCEKMDRNSDVPAYYTNDDRILIPSNIYDGSGLKVGNNLISTELSQVENFFEEVARKLAEKMKDPHLREALKVEAGRRFDGDYDILFKNFVSDGLDGVGSLKSYLYESGLKTDDHPLLNLSIPVHIKKWDTENFEILVAAWVNDKIPYVKAFDSNGKEYLLDQKIEPNMPVLVVGYNERVDESGNLEKVDDYILKSDNLRSINSTTPSNLKVQQGSSGTLILDWQDVSDETGYEVWRGTGGSFSKIATLGANTNNYVNSGLTAATKYFYHVKSFDGGGSSGSSNIVATTAANRDLNSALVLKRMKFTQSALQNVEGWTAGAPEIRLRVVKGFSGGAQLVYMNGNKFEPPHRNDIKDTWWNHQVTLIPNWNPDDSEIGTVLTFDWREEDALSSKDFTITASYEDKNDNGTVKLGGTYNINNDEGKDFIGQMIVFFWHDKYYIYNTTGFSWDFQN